MPDLSHLSVEERLELIEINQGFTEAAMCDFRIENEQLKAKLKELENNRR